jgi:galactokinase/mevalonate kinase-like predicted kinase
VGLTFRASAPGRCGILGNPSDIYGGKVLSCSLPVRATCEVEFRVEERLPEDRTLWNAATARFPLKAPVSVSWQSDVPRSSGLAGSTALLAATVACVLALRGEAPDLSDSHSNIALAELVRDLERYEAGVMCGYQDAYMVVHGGLQLMDFVGKHPQIPGPPARLQPVDAPLPFLLITTGVERLSGSVHGPMSERWLRGDKDVVGAMERLAELAPMGADALSVGNLHLLAELMTENQARIAQLGGSGDAVDKLVADCLACGALAAKLAGAGMGGTVIALSDDVPALQSSLTRLGYTRYIRPAVTDGIRFEAPTASRAS